MKGIEKTEPSVIDDEPWCNVPSPPRAISPTLLNALANDNVQRKAPTDEEPTRYRSRKISPVSLANQPSPEPESFPPFGTTFSPSVWMDFYEPLEQPQLRPSGVLMLVARQNIGRDGSWGWFGDSRYAYTVDFKTNIAFTEGVGTEDDSCCPCAIDPELQPASALASQEEGSVNESTQRKSEQVLPNILGQGPYTSSPTLPSDPGPSSRQRTPSSVEAEVDQQGTLDLFPSSKASSSIATEEHKPLNKGKGKAKCQVEPASTGRTTRQHPSISTKANIPARSEAEKLPRKVRTEESFVQPRLWVDVMQGHLALNKRLQTVINQVEVTYRLIKDAKPHWVNPQASLSMLSEAKALLSELREQFRAAARMSAKYTYFVECQRVSLEPTLAGLPQPSDGLDQVITDLTAVLNNMDAALKIQAWGVPAPCCFRNLANLERHFLDMAFLLPHLVQDFNSWRLERQYDESLPR